MSIVLPDTTLMTNPALLYSTWAAGATVTVSGGTSAAGSIPGDILAATEDTSHKFAGSSIENGFVIDATTPITADYLALLGPLLAGQIFTIYGTNDLGVAYTTIIESSVLGSDAAAWITFPVCTWRYWAVVFGDGSSSLEINHIAIGLLEPWPYFNEDWDADNLTVTGEQLVSAGGYYCGGVVQSAQRKMDINPGAVSPSEFEAIAAFADNVIRYQRGCFFAPEIDKATVYFGHIEDRKMSAPRKQGLHHVSPLTFVTRAD